jgi:hypothetical protein
MEAFCLKNTLPSVFRVNNTECNLSYILYNFTFVLFV